MSGLRLLTCLWLLGVSPAMSLRAQEDPKVDLTLGLASHDLDRGVVLANDSTVVSAEIARDGWKGNVHAASPLRASEAGRVRLGAGYVWQFASPLLEAGVQARTSWFTHALPGFISHEVELGVTLGRAGEDGFRPSVAYFRELRRRGDNLEVALAQEWPLTHLGTYLEGRAFAGWRSAGDLRPEANGSRIRDSYAYGGVGMRLPYRIGAYTTLAVGGELTGTAGQNVAWSATGRAPGVVLTGHIAVSIGF